MPNHLHLIICITPEDHVEKSRRGVSMEDNRSWKPGVLGAIVNQFKGACTRRIRNELNPAFAWQARFYDHIISTERDLDHLRWYISRNPKNWRNDEQHEKEYSKLMINPRTTADQEEDPISFA
jgi:putative transposase